MAQTEGFFELRTPKQLLDKLHADLQRLKSALPTSKEAQYAAFDFFVTAEHLPEWLARVTCKDPRLLRRYPDGPLVSHVANGAKHFRIDQKRHDVVRDMRAHSRAFASSAFNNDAFDVDRLIIDREDGVSEAVLNVASRVLGHWTKELG